MDEFTAIYKKEQAVVALHELEPGVVTVYVCDLCGQPLRGPHSWCNSGLHVGLSGDNRGRAVSTVQLVSRLRDALAPASPLQQMGEPG
jgi:hypothetical protein